MIRRLLLLTVALLVPVSAAAQSETEYYATDQLGSVRVFDANGNRSPKIFTVNRRYIE